MNCKCIIVCAFHTEVLLTWNKNEFRKKEDIPENILWEDLPIEWLVQV